MLKQLDNNVYQRNNTLRSLALKWLKQPHFNVKENLTLEGRSGDEYKMDFVVNANNSNNLVVKIADLKKSAGTDVIGKIEKIQNDLKQKTLLVSNKFSVQAKQLAQRAEVLLIDRTELEILVE
jgi:hypothetical protein